MRKIILPFLLASQAFGAFSLVGHQYGRAGGITSPMDTTGANLLVVVVSYQSGAGVNVFDSVGGHSNTWTALTARTVAGQITCNIWYSVSPTYVGAGHTFTIGGANTYPSIYAAAFSWAKTATPFDIQNGSTNSASSTISTGNITPGSTNELVIAGLSTSSGTVSSIGSSMIVIDKLGTMSGSWGGGMAYLIQTSPATMGPAWTVSGASYNAAIVASFLALDSAAGVTKIHHKVTSGE